MKVSDDILNMNEKRHIIIMTTTTKEKENILDFTFHLSETVKREGWISHYDVDSDSFALVSPKLSDDARKEILELNQLSQVKK